MEKHWNGHEWGFLQLEQKHRLLCMENFHQLFNLIQFRGRRAFSSLQFSKPQILNG